MAKKGGDSCARKLGAKGGKKGGPARSKALSSARRTQIARQGGKARQAKKS